MKHINALANVRHAGVSKYILMQIRIYVPDYVTVEGEMHLPGVREREDEVWVDSTMIMLIMPNVINMYLRSRIALKSPIEIARDRRQCVPGPRRVNYPN